MLPTTFRGLKMWRKPTPSLHKYNQNFKLNNCAISDFSETSHIFKPLLNAVLYFRNLINKQPLYAKFVFGFPLSRKLDLSRKVLFPATYFQHKVIRQSSVQISLITQNFSAAFLEIIKRKNRREAFCVSSENILHLTFCSYPKVAISKRFTIS